MKQHFSSAEWAAYKSGSVEPQVAGEMEEHLDGCEHCFHVYLETISELDIAGAAQYVTPEFVTKIMQEVTQLQPLTTPQRPAKAKQNVRLQIFAYYVAAASITLMLMCSGVFDLLGEKVPATVAQYSIWEKRLEERIPANWSAGIISKTTGLIDSLTGQTKEGK